MQKTPSVDKARPDGPLEAAEVSGLEVERLLASGACAATDPVRQEPAP